jgi:hypothetical protein
MRRERRIAKSEACNPFYEISFFHAERGTWSNNLKISDFKDLKNRLRACFLHENA